MEKKQMILRISPALWEELNKMAEEEYRSLNSEIEYILTKAVRNRKTKLRVVAEELVDALSFAETGGRGSEGAGCSRHGRIADCANGAFTV